MDKKIKELAELMAEQLNLSDLIAAEQLAKISAKIVKCRLKMDMSQKEFAKFMGVSQSMVSKWESDDYNFSVESLARICEKLNLDLEINLRDQNSQTDYRKNSQDSWNINGSQGKLGKLVGVA